MLCISNQKEFIINLNVTDIFYLFNIFISSDKYKKELTNKKKNMIEKSIYCLNIIYLENEKELFDLINKVALFTFFSKEASN